MTEDDWMSVRIEKGLALEMDKLIASPSSRLFGSRKYTSRAHFVKTAIIKLLEQEAKASSSNKKVVAAEVTSKR